MFSEVYIFLRKVSVVLILLLSVFKIHATPPEPDCKTVEVECAKKSDLTEIIRLIGTVQATRSTLFAARNSGILMLVISAGKKASEGELIAHLENSDLAKAFALSKHSESIAEDQYKRFLSLAKTNSASKQDVDSRLNLWNESQKQLADAKIKLEQTQFLAPYPGIVGVYLKRQGSQVQAGDSIVNFYDPSSLVVEFDIPEEALKLIKENQSLLINGKKFLLTTVQKMIDPETHMSPASVDYTDNDCIIGGLVSVDLILSHKENIICLPTEAVFLKQGKTYVYTVNKEEKADLVPVSIGIRQEDNLEILSGIQEGDQVIVKNPGRLYPGISIKIATPSPSSPSKESVNKE